MLSRPKAGLSFVHLHDGSCFDSLQIVAGDAGVSGGDFTTEPGCAVIATGHSRRVRKGQGLEVQAETSRWSGGLRIETYPIQPKPMSFEHLRDVAHLRQDNTLGAVAGATLPQHAIHRYFRAWICLIHTPIITASDAEGAGACFATRADLANPSALPAPKQDVLTLRKTFGRIY